MRNKELRKELKQFLTSELVNRKFSGRFPHFQRRRDNTLDLLSVEFDKWGEGFFFLEFCSTDCGDKTMPWGEVVAEQLLTVAHIAAKNRARLQAIGGNISDTEQWYQFKDRTSSEFSALLDNVAAHLPQLDHWLFNGEIGPNLSLV